MFERLTDRTGNGQIYLVEGLEEDMYGYYTGKGLKQIEKVIDRLAAYEDSGLSPEEVVKIKKCLNMWIEICKENNVSIVQFKKWAEAEQDGRVMMLPCKVGDLQEKYRELTKPEPNEAETYTTGYRNGIRNGQAELIAYLLQIDTGTKEAAEKALGVGK